MSTTSSRERQKNSKVLPILTLYALSSLYRLINSLLVQTQFDPDEFWQNHEPSYCLTFSSSSSSHHNCAYTWEWTRRWHDENNTSMNGVTWNQILWGPIRSHVAILPTYFFYMILNKISFLNSHDYVYLFSKKNMNFLVAKGPNLIHSIFIAAPTDVSVVCIARWISRCQSSSATTTTSSTVEIDESRKGEKEADNKKRHKVKIVKQEKKEREDTCYCFMNDLSSLEKWAWVCTMTNWFHGYALIRTYSNSVEAMMLLMGIALLGPIFMISARKMFLSSNPGPYVLNLDYLPFSSENKGIVVDPRETV